MKLHPRHDIVTLAELDIKKAVIDAASRHMDLTYAELIWILSMVLVDYTRGAIRAEREEEAGAGQ